MEKKMIIRGVAILCAGISASVFATNHLSGNAAKAVGSNPSERHAQSSQVMGASLVGNGAKLQFGTKPTADIPAQSETGIADTEFAALDESGANTTQLDIAPLVLNAMEFASNLELAEGQSAPDSAACSPSLTSAPMVDGLIELMLDAPCHSDTRLVISHNDLAFSAYTSDDGSFSAFLPALSVDAKVDVFLSDDIFLQTELTIPDADDHLRIALQWNGEARFSLHAYHDGAQHGDTGHVHALKPFDSDLDEAFLISLGEVRGPEPMIAEIYSIPVGLSGKSRVEVELQFTEEQCAQDVSAFISDNGDSANTHLKEIVFAVPECPAQPGMVVMGVEFAPQHVALSQ
ncbi:hypothetical protein [Roseinatronobacter monicus]|uniref:hypothetical protein n=1 Tax=Roseinatronobacter monicus TaxID=393481 RepID=UPI003F3C70E6